ncbi:MAG: MMPL family transporter [Bacteroidota bacterium]
MDHFFVTLNKTLTGRRRLFLILFLLFMVVTGYLASGVKLEENLNAIIPEDQRISKISALFDKSELADQIIFILSLKDSAATDPLLLIEHAELLAGRLETDSSLIEKISFKVGGDVMMNVYDFIYNNLPLFLNDEDYDEIAGMLTAEEIDQTILKDFKTLISPAGLATRQFILRDPLNLTPLALKKLDQFQLDDNFSLYNSAIFTKDHKHLLFFLDPVYPGSNTKENLRLIELIEREIENLQGETKGTLIEYYGGTAVAVANSVRVKKDIVLTVSIALLFFLLVFFAFFRRLNVILLMFLPVVIGAGFSIAMLTLIYGKVSAISLGVGVIFIGITVDYSLHLFTHIRSGSGVAETLRRISTPVLMSSLTTASAFLCLLVVRSEALKQIGLFAAFAVVASALSVLVVTPLFIGNRPADSRQRATHGIVSLIERVVGYRFEQNRVLVAVIFLLTIGFAFTSRNIRFNGDISTLNYQTEKLNQSEAKLKSISSVANSSVYLVTQGASLDEALEKLERNRALIESCLEEGLITEVSSVSELMLTVAAQRERIEKWEQFWAEADRSFVERSVRQSGSRYHFREYAFDPFFELMDRDFTPIPPNEYGMVADLFLDNYIDTGEGITSVVSILKVEAEGKEALFSRIASSDDFIIFDNQYFINQFFDVLKEDFNQLVMVSMIVVFLILLLFFGRIEIALITFIPILISWLWTLGLMGLFNIEINIFNIIISTFVFGLGIDYCIFIMNGIITNHREGNHSLVPYKLSILLSALTTISAVGVLIFAQHPALRSIAIVSILGISTVLLISYTLLPLLFGLLVRKKGERRVQPVTLGRILATAITFVPFLGSALFVTPLLPVLFILPINKRSKKMVINRLIHLYTSWVVAMGFTIKKRYIQRERLDFSSPSVIISNHQSQLDLVLLLQLHPKMIVLVNKWVWNNLFYGFIVRFADFYPIYKGLNYNFEKLQQKVSEGYSILAFPESSRTPDGKIKRFHQGAFGIADKLGLEVQPVMIHGAWNALPKTEHILKPGIITMKFFPRIVPAATEYNGMKTYRTQVKEVTAFYREEYLKLEAEAGTPAYYRGKLIGRYLYMGPVLEWYLRLKLRFEKDYSFFNDIIPRDASIVDLGCGYGFLPVMLGMVSGARRITGIDYDQQKIAVARHVAREMDHLRFETGDITTDPLPDGEVLILNDVLHYMPGELQLKLLAQCMEQLPEGGMIIMRDADADLQRRTRYTKFTEIQSTRIFRFNKTRYRLTYLSGKTIEEFVRERGFRVERHDLSRRTANITYIITRKKRGADEQ